MVKAGGHIALFLPLSSMVGGSDSKFGKSWQKLRGQLAQDYNDVIIVSIAQGKDIDASFSADTGMAEVIVIARRRRSREAQRQQAHFVNLNERPSDKLSAQESAKSIKRLIAELTQPGAYSDIKVGDVSIGTVQLRRINPSEKWATVRIANLGLVQTTEELAQGKLTLPQRKDPVPIPMTRIGRIGRVGPLDRDIASGPQEPKRGPFTKHDGANSGTEWPFLWNHNSKKQQNMEVSPDSHGIVKDGYKDEAEEVWGRASHLHISKECRFNSSPTCAVFTQRVSLGGRSWPSFSMRTMESEKVTCTWLNGTLGLIGYWIESNRSQTGRGGTSVSALPRISTLDVTKISATQLQAAVQIYDDLCQQPMLPANEAYRDQSPPRTRPPPPHRSPRPRRHRRRPTSNTPPPVVPRTHCRRHQDHRPRRLTTHPRVALASHSPHDTSPLTPTPPAHYY